MTVIKECLVYTVLYCFLFCVVTSGFKQCPNSKDPVNPEDVRLTQPACTDDDPCEINIKEISTFSDSPEFEGYWNYTTPDYPVYGGRIFLYLNLTVNGETYSTITNLAKAKNQTGDELSVFKGGFPANTNIDIELWAFLGNKDIPSGKGTLCLELEVKPYKPKQGEEQRLCVCSNVEVTGNK